MSKFAIKNNLEQTGVRREVFEGVEHLVVPVVMIVDGVLNGALVTEAEYGKYVESWNSRPVPVLHPERDGIPVSAAQPDIIQKNTIGVLFNVHAESGKLKGEAWLNVEKAKRLGYEALLAELAAGAIIEVSTGYFSDAENKAGEFNGETYTEIHRNIRPDHLALLPGEIGACSVAEGCGTRVNSEKGFLMKTKTALTTLAQALGLRVNCNCEEDPMDLLKRAEQLKANGSLTAKQFTMLQEMDEEGRTMMRALIDALGATTANELPEEELEEDPAAMEEEPKQMKRKDAEPVSTVKTFSEADVEKIVANQLRRSKVTEKLAANKACAFDEAELRAMSIEALEKYEKSIRPVDYSGNGGFATNSDAVDSNVTPLLPRSSFTKKKEA